MYLCNISIGSVLVEPSEILLVQRWRHNLFMAGFKNDIFLLAQMIWGTSEAQVFPEVSPRPCSGVC